MNDESLPARIDRYEPLRRLATGGMAELFLAKQSGLEGFEKVVVLKRILSHLAQDSEFVSMFLDEARIAAKLSHPNVVQIYDLGKADSSYYIAMEYVSGRNVQALISKQQERGGFVPVEHVCRIIAGVCDGLFYAHSRKDYDGKPLSIIHRDISPQNILVSFAGGVKVVDFGIAKASTQLAQTRAGVLKGKYSYMSPEQVRGAKIDHRSDIFAVGLVMYELLTGARAFERDSSLKTLKAIVQEKPVNPLELNPDVPMAVVKLLSKALEKNPDRRYKTAQEMQLALEDYLESSPKKSNNVRLSRYMYELFDDELNSAEGTMVVKGVGQVIIPTAQARDAKPSESEEVASATVASALMPEPSPERKAKATAAANPVTKAESVRAPAAGGRSPPAAAAASPADDGEDDDDHGDRTVPVYDIEAYERERAARAAADGVLRADSAEGRAALEALAEAEEEDREDKTQALPGGVMPSMPVGVPVAATPSPPPVPPPAARPSLREDTDARAAAMLAKLERIAPASATNPEHRAMTASLEAQSPNDLGDADTLAPGAMFATAPPEPNPNSNRTRPMMPTLGEEAWGEMQEPPTPADGALTTLAPAGSAAKAPYTFYATVGASLALSVGAAAMLAYAIVAMPVAVPAVEFGVVAVTTTPEGATVLVDGQASVSPAQVAVPMDGEHIVEVSKEGFKPGSAHVTFANGSVQNVAIALDPAG